MMMFSTGAALGKVAVERYLMRRVWKLSWKDGMMAFGGALLGYITYRVRYGNKSDNPLTR
jgi:hypothetical protein